MQEIRKLRRENLDKSVQHQLRREDDREERELQAYVMRSLAHDMINSMPGAITPARGDEVKAPAERQDTTMQWSNEQQMDHSNHR